MDPILILLVGISVILISIILLKLHPFISLLLSAIVVAILTPESNLIAYFITKGLGSEEAMKMSHKSVGERIAVEFGNTCTKIGILIAMAAIIGKSMLESGAAEKIIRSMLKVLGTRNAPFGFALSSFFLTIPVFIDTVIFLMMPLAKAMALKMKKNYLLLALSVIAGAVMANSYVPPSPGPLFLASAMNVSVGLLMVCGILLGLCTISVGYVIAVYLNKKFEIPLRDAPDASIKDITALSNKEDKDLPPLIWAVLPALFPMVMICIRSYYEAFKTPGQPFSQQEWLTGLFDVVLFTGDKNIALFIGAIIALFTLLKYGNMDKSKMTAFVQQALMSGGGIILITASGGAFGGMLQQTGIRVKAASRTAHANDRKIFYNSLSFH